MSTDLYCWILVLYLFARGDLTEDLSEVVFMSPAAGGIGWLDGLVIWSTGGLIGFCGVWYCIKEE